MHASSRYKRANAEVKELEMYIENTKKLYDMFLQICKNLINKKARNEYSPSLAVKAFMYLVDAGAKEYVKEHGSKNDTWNDMFPKDVRTEVAKNIRDEFEEEAELGNLDHLLAKKYQQKKESSYSFSRYKRANAEVKELEMYIENTKKLYDMFLQICKNLINKKARNEYSASLAVKAFMYLVDAGAKEYVKEHGSKNDTWNDMFPKDVRTEVAKNIRNEFEEEAELGNLDHLLAKKYQQKKESSYSPSRYKIANELVLVYDDPRDLDKRDFKLMANVLSMYGDADSKEGRSMHRTAYAFNRNIMPTMDEFYSAKTGLHIVLVNSGENLNAVDRTNIKNTIENIQKIMGEYDWFVF